MSAEPAGRCAWAALYGNEPLRVLKEKLLQFVAGACKDAAAEKSAFRSPPLRWPIRALLCVVLCTTFRRLRARSSDGTRTYRVQACAGTVRQGQR